MRPFDSFFAYYETIRLNSRLSRDHTTHCSLILAIVTEPSVLATIVTKLSVLTAIVTKISVLTAIVTKLSVLTVDFLQATVSVEGSVGLLTIEAV
jgi:hypothetical protein